MTTRERKQARKEFKKRCLSVASKKEAWHVRCHELKAATYWSREAGGRIVRCVIDAGSDGISVKDIADRLPDRDPIVVANIVRRGVSLGFYIQTRKGKEKRITVFGVRWQGVRDTIESMSGRGKDHIKCLRCLANPVGFVVYNIIDGNQEINVTQIEQAVGAEANSLSPILKRMREAGLVKSKKSGVQRKYYTRF